MGEVMPLARPMKPESPEPPDDGKVILSRHGSHWIQEVVGYLTGWVQLYIVCDVHFHLPGGGSWWGVYAVHAGPLI